jgi:hypothetical protein
MHVLRCATQCTNALPEKSYVYGVLLHAHTAGVAIEARHISADGTEQPPLAQDKHYDFNLQQWTWLPEPRLFGRGDQVIVTCTYNTVGRTATPTNPNAVTLGGEGTDEEMCLVYVLASSPGNEIGLTGCISTGTEDKFGAMFAQGAFGEVPPLTDDFTGWLKFNASFADNFETVYDAVDTSPLVKSVQPVCIASNGQLSFPNKTSSRSFEPRTPYVPPTFTSRC